MTYSYMNRVAHESFTCVTWLIYTWDMTHPSVRHDSSICEAYGVATISRLLKIIRLFCRIPSLLQGSFAKETYNFKEPTNRSHPIAHSYVRHDSFVCETWLMHMWDMNHSYVRHDSSICETWLIHMWDMTHSCDRHDSSILTLSLQRRSSLMWLNSCDSFMCVMGPIGLLHMCDVTHTQVRHDSSILTNRLQRRQSYVCHDSFICETWLIHICAMTHMTHARVVRCMILLIHTWDMTHSYVWHDSQGTF